MTINSDNVATRIKTVQYSAKHSPNGIKVLNASNSEDSIK